MARELGRISLAEALELTILIATREPRRLSRVGVRWLERYIQECEPTLANVALAVSALSALADEQPAEATACCERSSARSDVMAAVISGSAPSAASLSSGGDPQQGL